MSLDLDGPQAPAFTTAEPDYQPSHSLEERLRQTSTRTAALTAESSGTFVDNGTDRWHYMVTDNGNPDVLTLQLQVSDETTWWKTAAISASLFGSWYKIRELGTKNDKKVATVDLTAADAQSGTLKIDFWKAGFFNVGAYVATLVIDVPSNLGHKITFLCDQD